ncbi:DUF742 domain-containing protein [Cryptosporangium minutisporangium]|uniref:DUF742 domain-containing protein n=1 Tax=Cryptosporangium minutisporangium TaxID=113569 RepID=A0ABP6T4S9_9ACTN
MTSFPGRLGPPAGRPGAATPADEDPVVRPFVLTGGRTVPLRDGLRIETQLQTTPSALAAPLRFESRRIVELCQAPKSMADLSAALRAPLAVVRILVSDLLGAGHLRTDAPVGAFTPALIERIRDRVRAL